MQKIEMIWAMFKVYLNNPNYYVKQEDILANVCGNGSRDVRGDDELSWYSQGRSLNINLWSTFKTM